MGISVRAAASFLCGLVTAGMSALYSVGLYYHLTDFVQDSDVNVDAAVFLGGMWVLSAVVGGIGIGLGGRARRNDRVTGRAAKMAQIGVVMSWSPVLTIVAATVSKLLLRYPYFP